MENLLFDIWLPFSGTQEGRWKELTSQLEKTMTGLGISEVEKRQVVKAMGEAKGHWYSCPNGHVYNIGDCGGATVVAHCPDCGAEYVFVKGQDDFITICFIYPCCWELGLLRSLFWQKGSCYSFQGCSTTRIGGTGHRLLASNRAAGHMDSSNPRNYQWGLQDGQFQE